MADMPEKPLKVLLVEDNLAAVEQLREMLLGGTASQFVVATVGGVAQGLQRLGDEHFDAVLLDLSGQGEGGLDIFVALHDGSRGKPIVVLTDIEDETLTAKMLWAGAQDCLLKGKLDSGALRRALWFAVERAVVLAAVREAQMLLQSKFDNLSARYDDQSTHLSELTADLHLAAEMQANLLPQSIPAMKGYDISAYYQACKEVGGDYYDFIEIGPETIGFVVADVSGKSVPGLLGMSIFRSLLRMNARRSDSAKIPLIATNKQIADSLSMGMFVTCWYGVLDQTTAQLRICSAGHNPFVHWRNKTGQCEWISPEGIAVGFDKGLMFDKRLKEDRCALAPGDRLVAYSDGLVEMPDGSGRRFGDKRLFDLTMAHAHRSSEEFINALARAIEDFRGNASQTDDITILTLRYVGPKPIGVHRSLAESLDARQNR